MKISHLFKGVLYSLLLNVPSELDSLEKLWFMHYPRRLNTDFNILHVLSIVPKGINEIIPNSVLKQNKQTNKMYTHRKH